MELRRLGPDGVQQRVAEIRSRIESLQGKQPQPEFPQMLGQTMNPGGRPAAMQGAIGDAGAIPIRPDFRGLGLQPKFSPVVLKGMAASAAKQAGVDPFLFDALVEAESGYNPMARSRVGAMGLAQLMPGTARELGVENPFDPMSNLQGGAKYLSKMIAEFGDLPTALAAYNAGPGRVREAGGVPNIAETKAYVERIMNAYNSRRPS